MTLTSVEHRFGPYGGQYVPETLMPALAELEQAWRAARDDDGYRLDHDFAFPDRAGVIERFSLHLTLDPVWRPTSRIDESYAAGLVKNHQYLEVIVIAPPCDPFCPA